MKSVLILGASSDVAIALAEEFAKQNYNLVLGARNHNRLQALKSDLEIRYNLQCRLLEFDAVDHDRHMEFIKNLEDIPSVTICCFGYLGNQEIAENSSEETMRIINVNYVGAISILNIIANIYKIKNSGCIIGISSVAGERGRASNCIYGSAKAGFTTYLSGLRNRMSPFGVNVISVIPGFINSKMTSHLTLPKLLTSSPRDVAKSIVNAYNRKKNIIYVKSVWRWIMLIITLIPEFIFKKLKL